ncbi:biogenesis of lysosome-related organelles complex 1 subunit 2 isoform X1 [Momordica charantia]|uniref:Biogenesis of lysosome-related organelles complex 1 subunit 2 isoform X1 n=1 Tax=Momordica charantia TaxID=3673 RepID=A0A6J1DN97_MOMCH|nr:biogenesis of lysosome-related organelles complex 1 subunit 2 isoform X1 [Momordica charantia]
MAGKEEQLPNRDELAVSLNEFFTSVSQMIKSDLLGSSNQLALLEKMNLRVAEEYKGFGDVASGMRVFVEQLKSKSGGFDAYISQIENIEHQHAVYPIELKYGSHNDYIFRGSPLLYSAPKDSSNLTKLGA